ncbi:MAG: hypothetical protein ACK44U_08275, partial [Sphingobacteriales bacterium]
MNKILVLSQNRIEDSLRTLTLITRDDITVEFPISILNANKRPIPEAGEYLEMSDEMYKTWFYGLNRKHTKEMESLLELHFGTLLEHSDLIMQTKEYYNIRSSWLTSGTSLGGAKSYTLGSLMESWLKNEIFYLPDENLYMINIGGSLLSGAHIYTAWSRSKKSFVKGHLQKKYGGWMNYYKAFSALAGGYPYRNLSDIISMKKLLREIGVLQ